MAAQLSLQLECGIGVWDNKCYAAGFLAAACLGFKCAVCMLYIQLWDHFLSPGAAQ